LNPKPSRRLKWRPNQRNALSQNRAPVQLTVGRDASAKREKLAELLAFPPLERLTQIHGQDAMMPVQALYATFLSAFDHEAVRSQLELPGAEGLSTPEFEQLTEVAREFKFELLTLLNMDARDDPLMEALLL
jgi:hypothetical protein